MSRMKLLLAASLLLGGCRGVPLRTDLSSAAIPSAATEGALIEVLMEALEPVDRPAAPRNGVATPSYTFRTSHEPDEIRRYLSAGFALTDIYCDRFFRLTNQSMRHRKFGRALTNDVGTAVSGVLGLITTVPKSVITGAATITGGLDSTWRNYDDSFVVAPDLQNVRALVLAAQDDFRARALDRAQIEERRPDYMTARASIVRYAGICTFLGMQSLLTQSIDEQRKQLQATATPTPAPSTAPSRPVAVPVVPPQPAPPKPGPAAVRPAASPEAPAFMDPAARVGAVPWG